MPSVPRFCASTAVLMPISSPSVLISAPPELPKLMAASVWMKSSKSVTPSRPRPVALTMPCVTVWLSPNGLPIASTTSPARSSSERPIGMTGGSLSRHAQNRQIGVRVHADDLGRGDAPVRQLHADLIRALDDMVIGDDVTGPIDDHAGAEAALDALAHCRQMLPQQRIRARGPGARRRPLAPYRC